MQKISLSKNRFLSYFVISLSVHFLVLFLVFYNKQNKNMFVQVPLEVSFYSPVQDIPQQKISDKKVVPVKEKKAKPKTEEKISKDDIALENSKKVKQKETVKEPEKQKAEEVPEDTDKPNEYDNVKKTESSAPSKGIMLENADFKYSYYTATIVKKISRFWQWSGVSASNRALVYFRIAKNGYVSSVQLKESSGDELFDQNALRAVQLASPFAPLPDAYNQDYLGVYFEFKFR